jgi:phosphatidylglycerophosphate synthase
MGLRLIAIQYGMSLSVAYSGKVKTVIHSICLTWLILNPYQALGFQGAFWWNGIEAVLIFLSLLLTVLSGWIYYRRFAQQWKEKKLW